jgi:hypothetical protein
VEVGSEEPFQNYLKGMAPDLSEKVEAVSSMLKKYSTKSLLEAVLNSFPAIPFTKPTLLK